MRIRHICFQLLVLFALAFSTTSVMITALAAPLAEPTPPPRSEIAWPKEGARLFGPVAILGTAAIVSFQKYELAYKLEPSTDEAYQFLFLAETPVIDDILGTWDTTGLTPGVYSLRLRVVKLDGNYLELYAYGLNVNQAGAPLPTVTPPARSPTPTPVPIPVTLPPEAGAPAFYQQPPTKEEQRMILSSPNYGLDRTIYVITERSLLRTQNDGYTWQRADGVAPSTIEEEFVTAKLVELRLAPYGIHIVMSGYGPPRIFDPAKLAWTVMDGRELRPDPGVSNLLMQTSREIWTMAQDSSNLIRRYEVISTVVPPPDAPLRRPLRKAIASPDGVHVAFVIDTQLATDSQDAYGLELHILNLTSNETYKIANLQPPQLYTQEVIVTETVAISPVAVITDSSALTTELALTPTVEISAIQTLTASGSISPGVIISPAVTLTPSLEITAGIGLTTGVVLTDSVVITPSTIITTSEGITASNGVTSSDGVTISQEITASQSLTTSDGVTSTLVLTPDIALTATQAITSISVITPEVLGQQNVAVIDGGLVWSHSGSQLAFVAASSGGSANIFIYDLTTQNIYQISREPTSPYQLTWSPDDRRIFYRARQRLANTLPDDFDQTYIANVDGSGAVALDPPSAFREPLLAWISSQALLIYAQPSSQSCGNRNLRLINVVSGKRFTLWQGNFEGIGYSPEQQEILLTLSATCEEGAGGGVYRIALNDLTPRRVTQEPFVGMPQALPEARWLFYDATGVPHVLDGVNNLYVPVTPTFPIKVSALAATVQPLINDDRWTWNLSAFGGGIWTGKIDTALQPIGLGPLEQLLWSKDGDTFFALEKTGERRVTLVQTPFTSTVPISVPVQVVQIQIYP